MEQKIVFLYRDADNYKSCFSATIQTENPLAEGDIVSYLDLGFSVEEFHQKIVGYGFNPDSDHTLVEAVGVLTRYERTEYKLKHNGNKRNEAGEVIDSVQRFEERIYRLAIDVDLLKKQKQELIYIKETSEESSLPGLIQLIDSILDQVEEETEIQNQSIN